MLGSILEDDYELLYAENGEEALQIMWEQRERLSIVLLDLMMPVLNGFEVLETVRKDELLRQIPIIVLTAERSAELQALQLGASDFIPKPFDEQEVILARVSRVVELSEGRQLISAAERDKLSMLYTRNFFMEYAERIFQYHSELHMDAVVINIEQFHSINALNGRSFGDRVLQVIGEEIKAFLAGTEGIASRFDADRFAIYCMQQPDYYALLNRFQDRVNRLTRKVSIRLRMGVKTWQKGVEPLVMFDHDRGIQILRVEKLMDKHIRKLPKNGVIDAMIAAGVTMDPVQMFEAAHAAKGVCGNLGLEKLAEGTSEIAEEFRPGNSRHMTDGEVREKLGTIEALYHKTVEGIQAYEKS